jgi:predicted permease
MFFAIRYALRQLRRSYGFAITAILTLALGIGITTTIFSVVDAVLLEPLPFAHPERLVAMTLGPLRGLSVPTAQSWQERSRSFQSIAGYRGWSPTIRSSNGAQNARVLEVTQNFLSTLDAHLMLGRDFARSGSERDCPAQAIVSGNFWRQLGGGSSLAGRTLEIDRRTYQIAGVLAQNQPIEGPSPLDQPEILVPAGCDPSNHPEKRGSSSYQVVGRLREGVGMQQAQLDIATVQRALIKDLPVYYPANYRPNLQPWKDYVAGEDTQAALYATLGACGLLLLIACANLTNLLLARNTSRRAEFATRATLGASLGQILRQLLVESAVLSVLGAVLGICFVAASLQLLRQLTLIHIPRLAHAALHGEVLAFAIFIVVSVTVSLTVLPAWRTIQSSLVRDLSRGGQIAGDRSLRRAGQLLVVGQLSLAMVLIAAAGWMASSVLLLLHQPLGFEPSHLLIAGVDVHGSSIAPAYDAARTSRFFNDAVAELRRLPGVKSVAAVNHPPLGGYTNRFDFCTDVHPEQCRQTNTHSPDNFHVTPGYFAAIGQTFYQGRDFTSDDDDRSHVAIVNRALAEQEWPGKDPIGRRLYTGDINEWATVVGVVGDIHNFDLSSPAVPNLYLPEADNPQTAMAFALRTTSDPELLAHQVRETLHRLYPDLALYRLESMPHIMSRQVAQRTFLMWLVIAFGVLSLLIAIVGTYGLLAYEISAREKEIGLRIALGSSREGVVRLLLQQESQWIFLGAGCGLLCAGLTGYLLRSQFYAVGSTSPFVLVSSAALLVLPALTATVLPAWRAARLDPVTALRSE